MALKSNLVIDQGTTYSVKIDLINELGDTIDLENYTARSEMRKWYTSTNATATFTTSINVESGSVTLSLSASESANITAGRYVYDVELVKGEEVSRIVEGIITVTPEVTRNG